MNNERRGDCILKTDAARQPRLLPASFVRERYSNQHAEALANQ